MAEGSFLVRSRESNQVALSYALSVVHKSQVTHHLLEQSTRGRPFRVNGDRTENCLLLADVIALLSQRAAFKVPVALTTPCLAPDASEEA